MKGLDELIANVWLLFGIYSLVLILIIADLWAGIRKAKHRGEIRSSFGYKRTVHKVARYYNALLALTVIDCMQIGSVWYFHNYYDWKIPLFPVVTLVGAIGIGLIEIKSIFEKAEAKVKNDYMQVAELAVEIAQCRLEPEEIAKAISKFIKLKIEN